MQKKITMLIFFYKLKPKSKKQFEYFLRAVTSLTVETKVKIK